MKNPTTSINKPDYPVIAGILTIPIAYGIIYGLLAIGVDQLEVAGLTILIRFLALAISAHALFTALKSPKSNQRTIGALLCAVSTALCLYPLISQLLGIPYHII